MRKICICCGSDVDMVGAIPPVITFAGRVLSRPLAGGELAHCPVCNVSFRFPQPDKASLDELYRQGTSDNWKDVPADRVDWNISARWLFTHLNPNSSILDVGCFDGSFLNTIQKFKDRSGIEIHEEAGRKAQERGIKIVGKDFSDLNDIAQNFDAVTSFDVIEHAHNPLEFLKELVRLTKSGGTIILSTGNSDALSWKLEGSRYWYCTIGEHLAFINPKWCEVEGKRLGLEIKQVVKFSHTHSSLAKRVAELVKNLFFAITPKGFALLRRMGMGGDEYRTHSDMLMHPPTWLTAKDHFICIFTKQ